MDSTDFSEQRLSKKFRSYSSENCNEDNLSYGFSKERVEGSVAAKKHKQEKNNSFLDLTDENNLQSMSDATELTSLRPRGAVSNSHTYSSSGVASTNKYSWDNIVILEREILPSDTLQSFALLYGCTLNDLKRLNNLIKEQDFYALRQIKIPVKKYGLMTEPEEEVKRRPATSSQSYVTPSQTHIPANDSAILSDIYHTDSQDEDLSENQTLLPSSTAVNNKTTAVYHNDASKFLKNVDKEIRNTVKSVHATGKNETLEEVVSSLGSVGFQPLPLPTTTKLNECDGATWGLKWSTVLVSFVFGLALVTVFIILKSSFPFGL